MQCIFPSSHYHPFLNHEHVTLQRSHCIFLFPATARLRCM